MRHVVAVVVALLLAATTVSAATFEPVTDAQLIEQAQLVITGQVLDSASRVRADGVIVTDYRIAADDVLKGRAGAIVTVTEIGGRANGIVLVIPGSARYTAGSRVLAFLRQRDDGTWFTSSMSLGHYRFATRPDHLEVLQRDEDGAEVSDPSAFTPRVANAFVAYVHDLVQGKPAPTSTESLFAAPLAERFKPETDALVSDYVLKDGSPLRPIRWKGCEAGCTINYKLNDVQPGVSDVPGGIDHALAAWTNHADSFVNLQLTGLSPVTNVAVFDSENTIVLNNSASPNVGQCDGTLACGMVWLNDGTCTSSNCHDFRGETFYTALGGDVVIRPNTLGQSFFEALVAHEVGHSIALRHAPTSGNLMSPSIPSNASATLKTWDKEAMAEVYGNGLPCQPPAITNTTNSTQVTSGSTKTLTVSASGTTPLTYQWYEGTSGTTTDPVGTNSTSFTTPPITQSRSYWVRVTNTCGSADSGTITISPTTQQCTAPAVTLQPVGQTIVSGASATLNVDASGTAPLSYQWYEGAVGDTSKPVSTLKTFTTPALTATTSYWVRVFNACGNANSNLATITVTQQCVPASITTQPINTDAALGEGITLSVGTGGTAPLTFQWYKGTSPDISQPIAEATTASYATPPFATPGSYTFWVRVSNTCGSANSATITVAVACPVLFVPVISAPPASPATAGYDVSWGGNTPSFVSAYELQEATNADFTANLRTFVIVGDTTKHIDAHTEITADTRFFYRVLATNACNSVKSDYSTKTSTLVTAPLPQNSTEFSISVPDGVKQGFTQNYLVPGFGEQATNNDTFSITTDVPWLTVFPASGALSAGGTTVQFTFDTTSLDIGTTTATIVVTRTNGAGKAGTNGTSPPITLPFSVSLVTPVSPVPRNTNAPPGTLIIPAIAHADGIGTRFQSDVRIANTSNQPITYQLSFTPSGVNGTQVGKQTTLTINAKDSKGLDDIVKAWYGSGVLGESGLGTLEIRPLGDANPQATFASSRTYAISSAGTLGQFIPAIALDAFVGNSAQNPLAKLSLQQIASSAAYRTNFGFVEGAGQSVEMLIKLLDGNNNVLASVTKSLQPYEHQQLGFASIFPAFENKVTDGRLEVSTTSGTGKVTAYASVVDNKTSDPLLVFPVQAAAVTSQHYVAPGIAELNNGSSNFHSDMRVFNGGSTPVAVMLRYFEQGSSTPNPSVIPRTIQPGEVLALDNILPTLWGLNASGGAVTVDAPSSSSLVVTARTYSRNSEAGTYGQFIPGVTSREAVGFGERSLELLQLEESAQYRTNLGLVEVTGNGVDLEISAYKPDTKLTTVAAYHLNANQFVQLGFVFKNQFQMPTVYQGRISVKVVGGEGRVAAYGSVVDNRTVDPTYVPAQ